MSKVTDPRLQGIDFEHSFLLGVIYDDESLTLEMEFNLTPEHGSYQAPQEGEEACFRGGYIRFAEIEDLEIDKAPAPAGEAADYSIVYSVASDGERFEFSTGWGEIAVSAKSVRIALD